MEHKTSKNIRVTIVNLQGGAKKVIVVEAGNWDSLIRQAADKFRIRAGRWHCNIQKSFDIDGIVYKLKIKANFFNLNKFFKNSINILFSVVKVFLVN